ncbi:uncharacterized protein LOC120640834 isoform X3 [Panicum virgatum]|uniref:uncharacterized protein LOC120640834 isoform X3 n=1 Tax=Panicum virgatum TaxID=38727 RepID=UPI0019D609CB|nr:uncharacterized protein LOC120640834 isoform X3 [Panicum virgatum]
MQCSRNGKARDDQGKKQEDDFQDKRQDFSACSSAHCCISAFGGKEQANEKAHKVHPGAASEKRAIGSRDMVKTNDYGRYDPSPAFSKPRFKLIPN